MDSKLNMDELLGEFYSKIFGTAARTMGEYYGLLERAWNTPRPGRNRDFSTTAGQLAVSRNRHEQVRAISPEEIDAGLALLARALGESDDPRVRERIGIVRDDILSIPWPDAVRAVMRAATMANDSENLLRNPDLELTGKAAAVISNDRNGKQLQYLNSPRLTTVANGLN